MGDEVGVTSSTFVRVSVCVMVICTVSETVRLVDWDLVRLPLCLLLVPLDVVIEAELLRCSPVSVRETDRDPKNVFDAEMVCVPEATELCEMVSFRGADDVRVHDRGSVTVSLHDVDRVIISETDVVSVTVLALMVTDSEVVAVWVECSE